MAGTIRPHPGIARSPYSKSPWRIGGVGGQWEANRSHWLPIIFLLASPGTVDQEGELAAALPDLADRPQLGRVIVLAGATDSSDGWTTSSWPETNTSNQPERSARMRCRMPRWRIALICRTKMTLLDWHAGATSSTRPFVRTTSLDQFPRNPFAGAVAAEVD